MTACFPIYTLHIVYSVIRLFGCSFVRLFVSAVYLGVVLTVFATPYLIHNSYDVIIPASFSLMTLLAPPIDPCTDSKALLRYMKSYINLGIGPYLIATKNQMLKDTLPLPPIHPFTASKVHEIVYQL